MFLKKYKKTQEMTDIASGWFFKSGLLFIWKRVGGQKERKQQYNGPLI
jgi:hypothetical protein